MKSHVPMIDGKTEASREIVIGSKDDQEPKQEYAYSWTDQSDATRTLEPLRDIARLLLIDDVNIGFKVCHATHTILAGKQLPSVIILPLCIKKRPGRNCNSWSQPLLFLIADRP